MPSSEDAEADARRQQALDQIEQERLRDLKRVQQEDVRARLIEGTDPPGGRG